MKIDPDVMAAPKAIHACPKCGNKTYQTLVGIERGEARATSVICKACGFDILAAYRKLKPKR